jgi:protein involved in ribonucleotide reduction
MKGEREEHHFGPDGQFVLILWPEAAYLKDDIDNVRILFTGFKDKQKVQDEVRRLVEYHQQKEDCAGSFSSGNEG